METLYHGSTEKLTELTVFDNDLFHGMFFSYSHSSAYSHGEYVYTTEIDDDDIVSVNDFGLSLSDDAYAACKKLYGDENADIMLDVVSETIDDAYDLSDEAAEVLARVFPTAVEEYEISFAMQRACAEVAEYLGYKAVEVHDEHGTSVIVLPSAKLKLEGEI